MEEAGRAAERTMRALSSIDHFEEGESIVRLAVAKALYATGEVERARASLRTARARLLDRASKIQGGEWRRSFLENVPENAQTLALAREWLDKPGEELSK